MLFFFCLLLADVNEVDEEESTVSLCQIRVQFDSNSNTYDDRTLVSLLATLKMHDFFIGQPVWGAADTLLYLCEHRLKVGLKQSTVERELTSVIRNGPSSSSRFAWTCA